MSELEQIYCRINGEYEIDESVKKEESEVRKFYANKTLFITGATGFMGKCLIEKLLRDCPGLKHIYLLMRPKRNNSVDERLSKFFQHEIFAKVRQINPSFEKKVTAMEGDLSLKNLGISDENRDILKKETNIIVHNAANVRFNERVHISLKVNVLGTMYMFDLAEECIDLEAFVYVSSAFSHLYNTRIEEKFYEPPGDLKMVYDMIDADVKTANGLTDEAVRQLIGDHPFIYTFTKAMSEELVRQRSEKANFACGIYRPSIVTSVYKEPLAGWVDNLNGPVLAVLGFGLGVVHTGYYPSKRIAIDFVPCDMSINALLAVTWDLPQKWASEKKAVIYNYGSSTTSNPTSLKSMYEYIKNEENINRSSNAIWMNFCVITSNFWLFMSLHVLFHVIPAFLVDFILLLTFRKPRAVPLVWKITKRIDLVNYFGATEWKIYMPNTSKVINRLNAVDQELFYSDVRKLDWDEYTLILWRGIRVHIMKEDINSNAGLRRYALLWYAHYGLITVLVLTFFYFVMRLVF